MAVRATTAAVRLRADEDAARAGLTFADLCALVDQGRELGIEPNALVTGDTWIRGRPADRKSYKLRYVEV